MNAVFMSQRVAKDIGNYIGNYIDGDPNNFIGVWREFLRIRVSIPLDIPIKRRMKLRKSEKEWCWVNFKYEAIPMLCFICGLIGHGERFCDRIFEMSLENIEKPYEAWLRAHPRRKTHTMGAKWLRSGGGIQARNSGEKGGNDEDKESPENVAQMQQPSTKSGIIVQTSRTDKGEISGILKGNRQTDNYQPIIHNSNIFEEGDNSGLDSLIVMDPKRRRTTLDQDKILSTAQDQLTEMEKQDEESQVSKNELLAGVASQPRHSS